MDSDDERWTDPPRLRCRLVVRGTLVALAVLVAPALAGAAMVDRGANLSTPPAGTAARPFPAGEAWWTPVPDAPRFDDDEDALRAALAAPTASRVANLYAFAVPVYTADRSTPRHEIEIRHDSLAAWGDNVLAHAAIPIPDDAVPAPGANGKLVVIDTATRQVFDLWRAERGADGWSASWGGIYPLDGDGSSDRPAYRGPYPVEAPTPLSRATGSGVSSLAGLIRLDEIAAGVIPHALAFSSDLACGPADTGPFRWPATTTDGATLSQPCIEQGTRVFLDPDVDLSVVADLGPGELAIGRALQRYGAYLTESGGARMAFMFELPTPGHPDPAEDAGLAGDYADLDRLPWSRLRVMASWDGR